MSALRRMLGRLRRDPAHSAAPEEWPISTIVRPEELSSAFAEAYGAPPDGVWRAPGRVALMGEHTDDNDGLVLPIALPWGVSVALSPDTSGLVELRSAQRLGEVARFHPADLHPGTPDASGWAGYVAGVFWAARENGDLDPGVGARVLIDSDLPVGAGLASSAALECATLLALVEAFGLNALGRDRIAMARVARRAETEFVGTPTGITDQNASLRCAEDHALFLDCRTGGGRTVPLALDDAGFRLLLIDTRVQRQLSKPGNRDAARRAECERAAHQLGVETLRDVEDLSGALTTLTDPLLVRRVRHVVTEIHRVNAAVGLMRAGALAELGPVFSASHLSLRDQFHVSCPELDLAVEAAVGAGARGARMTGRGNGGTAVALVAEERLDTVRGAVSEAFARRRWRAPVFRDAHPSAGAHRLT